MRELLISGLDQPAAAPVLLRAGPLTALYDPAAGDLRTIRLGGRELVRRVYAAVRDQNWGTVPLTLHDVALDVGADQFQISYTARHAAPGIGYCWRGTISGASDGTIVLAFDGVAETDFRRNRIGFCVLHPSELAGAACDILHVDGSTEQATFPEYLVAAQPVPPFAELRALRFAAGPGCTAELLLEGDSFEIEDQRNWTDASFKTFCTPLRLPYPVAVSAGDTVSQRVTLRLHGAPPSVTAGAANAVIVAPSGSDPLPLPQIGLGLAANEALDEQARTRLLALRLAHLRVDLRLNTAGWEAALARGARSAAELGTALEVALFTSGAPAELAALGAALHTHRPPVARWLVFHTSEHVTPTALLTAIKPHLGGAPLFGGTDTDFIFLNRTPPDPQHCDGLTFAVNPQVHAFDNASVLETCAAQAQAVASARRLAAGKPVAVSPLTLRPRFNPYAVAPPAPLAPGELPATVDVRQLALFGAVWTLASLRALTLAGTAAATYFETSGPHGVLATTGAEPHPQFPVTPGQVYPLYHVLRVATAPDAMLLPFASSDPLTVEVLVVRDKTATVMLLGNMTAQEQRVTLRVAGTAATLRTLDAASYHAACTDPDGFQSAAGAAIQASDDGFGVTLEPYAVAWVTFGQ